MATRGRGNASQTDSSECLLISVVAIHLLGRVQTCHFLIEVTLIYVSSTEPRNEAVIRVVLGNSWEACFDSTEWPI